MATRVLAAAIALVLLSACGSEGSDSARDPGPDTPVTSSPGPQPSGPVKGGAQRVEPQAGMGDVRPHPFEKVKVVDERSLRVFFYQGVAPCSVLDRVEIAYSARTVHVTLHVGHDEQAEDTACIEIAVYNYVDVRLDEPLDGRRVVDGALRDG